MNASPKILIIRLSSLGDILHALPAFSNLRLTFPDARIEWLVAKKCRFLPATVRGIDLFVFWTPTRCCAFHLTVRHGINSGV